VATLTERARVARELHDTVLQELTAVSLQLRTHRARLEGASEQEAMRLQDAVSRCLRGTREAVRGLRSSDAPGGRLGQALSGLARRLRESSPVPCQVSVDGTPAGLPETVEEELYRIGQEAITNALKHAEASRVDVRLQYGEGRLVLSVTDDGRGFDPDEPGRRGHFGLVGMRERAQQIGGELTIHSAPQGGTVIELSVRHE
jgi:signal transduction histidine kinase